MADVTEILSLIESGDSIAADQLLPIVYEELRKLAAAKLAHEQPGQTLQATALVHEAYIRLVDNEMVQHWHSRGHFFAAAAEAMRRILVENARRKGRLKRGGNLQRVEMSDQNLTAENYLDDLLMLDEALTRLESEDQIAAEIVKLRTFAGLSIEHAADSLGVSRATAYRNWSYAKAWLRCEIEGNTP